MPRKLCSAWVAPLGQWVMPPDHSVPRLDPGEGVEFEHQMLPDEKPTHYITYVYKITPPRNWATWTSGRRAS